VPVLWFGGDWWGSGDWWHGADVAQVAGGDDERRLERALTRAGEMLPWPLWIPAGVAVVVAWRQRARERLALTAVAAGWTVVVVVMCVVLRYAALGRFFFVAAGIASVGVGLGVESMVGEARRGTRLGAAAVAALVLLTPFLWPRVHILGHFADETPVRARYERDLDDAIGAAGGRDAVLGCGPVAIENADLAISSRPALAWQLDVPLSRVGSSLGSGPGVVFARHRSITANALAVSPTARELGRSNEWTVYAVSCPE
jgi:hypothetical protein